MNTAIKSYDFEGGLKLDLSHSDLDKTIKTVNLLEGDELHIPLAAHIGNPSRAIVEVGQYVRKFEELAIAQGHVSVAQHAPSSGVVVSVPQTVERDLSSEVLAAEPLLDQAKSDQANAEKPLANHGEQMIVISCDGLDEVHKLPPSLDLPGATEFYTESLKENLYRRIVAAGIIGMGGGGFPAHVKVKEGMLTEVGELIVNAVECEPLSLSDSALIEAQVETFVAATQMVGRLVEAKRIVIAVGSNVKSQRLSDLAAASGISIVQAPDRYPAGSEKQLIKIVTGKELPLNSLPIHIGVVCFNVATIIAMYEAAILGRPSIYRVLTLNGSEQTLVAAPVGLSICSLIERVEGASPDPDGVTTGGMMMSRPIGGLTTPVNKAITEISVRGPNLPSAELAQACVRCGECVGVCPIRLQPQKLYELSKQSDVDDLQDHGLFDCIECGCCDYVCPSNIPLVDYFRNAKKEVNALTDASADRAQLLGRYQAHLARQDNATPAQRNAALADTNDLTLENIDDELEKLKARLGRTTNTTPR